MLPVLTPHEGSVTMFVRTKAVLFAFALGSWCLAGCGESSISTSDPSDSGDVASGDVSAGATPFGHGDASSWTVTHSVPLEPWMQQDNDHLQQLLRDLFSGNSTLAEAAAQGLMELDPNLYPATLRALTARGDAEVQRLVEEAIDAYWASQRQGLVDEGGDDSCITYEVDGKITFANGSKVTIGLWLDDIDIDVGGHVVPVDTSPGECCGTLVATSKTVITGMRVPVKIPLPGYGPISSVTIDLVLIVDLTITVKYYDCSKEAEGTGR